MSEQADALTFGPQWIRDLSNGTSVCVPPPSPGPKYKLAEFRYGKEEMLALYSSDLPHPGIGELAELILTKEICEPLAYIPMSEEEQRTSFGSLNSAAVLKMMGRGGQRGGRGMSRGGRGGRGRSEGGFYRGFSVEESTSKGDDGWQRDAVSRRLSWGENGRGSYNERSTSREADPSSKVLELSAPPIRRKEAGRSSSSGNWRSSESGDGDDGGGGWIVSGSQRSEKWRGSGRSSWQNQGSREEYQGGGGERYNSSWDRGRHHRSNSDDLPEWSKSDNVFEPHSGSFDSTGAFFVTKDKNELQDTGQKDQMDKKETKDDWKKEFSEKKNSPCKEENDKVELNREEKTTDKEANIVKKDRKQEESQASTTDIQQQANVRQSKIATTKPTEKTSTKIPAEEEKAPELKVKAIADNEGILKSASPPTSPHDEIGAHLERVAESCIANLDVEGEDVHDRPQKTVDVPGVGARSQTSPGEESTKWFYRDPQGNEQGPFSSDEMVEWFHHGYFTMQLSIRRQCDVMYLPLGEVIKRWQRVPFVPGPAPPPITHQQLMSEQSQRQTMMMQQQLLQQHYQQLQKQAILQQIQQQQQQRHPAPTHHLDTSPDDPSVRPLHGGAAEVIWGTEPESPKGPWSPASAWDQQNRQKSPVPSVEETKRLAEEKAKAGVEKREAEFLALKQRQEEEKRQQMMKKEEEERLQREALQRENELRLKKQKEEEEEIRREQERRTQELQKQAEAEKRKQEAARQKKQAQQEQKKKKESGEQKQQKQSEMREQQKQALLRLQQQQERHREQERLEQQRLDQQRQEQEKQQRLQEERMEQKRQEEINAQQLLQQKKMQSNSSSRWRSQNAAALSLSEIQEQEEKNRRAHEEKMRELEARQRQLQTAASHGWAEKQSSSSPSVKSLKSIQDEQARQQRSKQAKQRTQVQPSAPSSGAWANSNSSPVGWGPGNNNIWSEMNEPDEPDDNETGFWAEAVRTASKTSKTPATKTNTSQPKVSSTQPVANGKKPGKKETKEEEKVRKLFQPTVSNDPFTEWCIESLSGLTTSVDVPTFVTFLKEVDSPYEIHDYVRDFFGESNQAKSFAKEFIEKKRVAAEKRNAAAPKPTPAASAKPSPVATSTVVARGGGGGSRMPPPTTTTNTSDNNKDTTAAGANGKNKKKKKQRMQKVDPRILGFSVNAAAERTNMGEIQSVDDVS